MAPEEEEEEEDMAKHLVSSGYFRACSTPNLSALLRRKFFSIVFRRLVVVVPRRGLPMWI